MDFVKSGRRQCGPLLGISLVLFAVPCATAGEFDALLKSVPDGANAVLLIDAEALKKTPLREGARLRRCRRCNSAMEDVFATPEASRDLPPWLQAAQRQCVCTCAWYLP